MGIFVQSAAQISVQNPLCDDWYENPIVPTEVCNPAVEADYKQFIPPMVSRRMGKIMKRAVATSFSALRQAGIDMPDAIITGTGLGCLDNTEKFLAAMVNDGEEFLQPTYFMQSTHNTISSQIALLLKCNNYNCTYSHRATSFESALYDAFLQFSLKKIANALVSGHDEMTPAFCEMFGKAGFWKDSFSGECSAAFVLAGEQGTSSLCRMRDVDLLCNPSAQSLKKSAEAMLASAGVQSVDALVMGVNGNEENDRIYMDFAGNCFPGVPVYGYKHLFGESYSVSALGMYMAAVSLQKGALPRHSLFRGEQPEALRNVVLYNHFRNKDHSLILLSRC